MIAHKKKKKKGNSISKSPIIYVLFFLLIILILMLEIYISNIVKNKFRDYNVESRVENIYSARKHDTDYIKTVGWLRVQGTNIDYPVIYAPGYNLGYITDDFTWTEYDFEKLNNIVYISGHNIKNLSSRPLVTSKNHSRFEQLMSFTYYDFAKDNQFIQYTFNGIDYVYKIFSVSYESFLEMDTYNDRFYTKKELSDYIKKVKKASLYKYDVDVNEDDYIIALDTCTRVFPDDHSMHFRVVGRLLRKNEHISKNKVEVTTKYKEIDEILKGGDSYEEA